MKKTLIALAAVAVSTGAMAQVTISGNMNINALGNSKLSTQASSTDATNSVKSRSTANDGGWTASELRISGSEDLGGGLRAEFAAATSITGGANFADRDRFLGLSGDFGTVRFGRLTPAAALGFHGYTGRVSTSHGGTTYGLASAGTNSAAGGATQQGNFGNLAGGNFERSNSKTIQYTSPNFNGLVANVSYSTDSTDDSAATAVGKDRQQQTGFSLVYAAGPLSVGFGTNDRKVDREAVPNGVVTATIADNDAVTFAASLLEDQKIKSDLDWFGASYDFGVAKVFGSHIKRKDRTTNDAGVQTVNANIKLNALGVSVPVGAFTLAATTYRGKNKGADNDATDETKLTGHQLNLTYELSKRTVIYAAVGESQVKRRGGNTDNPSQKFTSNAVGVMHSF